MSMKKLTQHLWKLAALIVLFLVLSGLLPQSLALADTVIGTGPGGVESTDGAGSLVLWLDANKIAGNDNSAVSAWLDKGGYGNNAAQSNPSNQPTLQKAELNGQSVVRFDGTSDFLVVPDNANLDNTNGLTFYAVINPSVIDAATRGILSKPISSAITETKAAYSLFFDTDLCANCLNIDINNYPGAPATNRYTSLHPSIPTFAINTPTQIGVLYRDTPPTESMLWVNTYQFPTKFPISTITTPILPDYPSNLNLGTIQEGAPAFYGGDIAEVIIFRKALTTAERLLVENYLGSKYGITIEGGSDFYNGDLPGNGDFDLNVSGIISAAATTNKAAFSVGLVITDTTFLKDSPDAILFGHRNITNTNTTADLPVGWNASISQRWLRHWYFSVRDGNLNGGTVKIAFDFSDGGMNGSPAGNPANYKLLKRTGPSGAFTEMTAYTPTIAGDQVIFSNVSVADLGSNFTLGTKNTTDSPTSIRLGGLTAEIISPTALTAGLLTLLLAGIFLTIRWKKR
jgi:hypothetical protein